MNKPCGYDEGDTCNRNGCQGVIACHDVVGCSCHINPPCSQCTAPRAYCPVCEWEEKDEEHLNGYTYQVDRSTGTAKPWTYRKRDLDPTKIDWHDQSHTHFSMIKKGVYPEGTTRSEVREKVDGTFGGRFESFGNGRFTFIAYTG